MLDLRDDPRTARPAPPRPPGDPPRLRRGLAERVGGWSADHWRAATVGWLVVVALAVLAGAAAGTRDADPATSGPGESGRMDRILHAGFRQPAAEHVLVQGAGGTGSPAFRAVLADLEGRLRALPEVASVRAAAAAAAADGRSALVDLALAGDPDTASTRVAPVLAAVRASERAHPGFRLGEFGDASAQDGVERAYAADLGRAGLLSLPVTLAVLVLAFGALVAAGLPLLLALSAVAGTMGLVALSSRVVPVAREASALVLLIGLAVGVDYALFFLRREREERAAGRDRRTAVAIAAATSGRTVLTSGLTVMAAMAGMLLTGDATFASLGVATMLVVAVAVAGSLTVLPALLARFGGALDRLRVPGLARSGRAGGPGRLGAATVDRVLRRPVLAAAIAGAALVALALPALDLHLTPVGPASFPRSLPVVQAYERMQAAFPGAPLPAEVVVAGHDLRGARAQAAIATLVREARARGLAHGTVDVAVNGSATVAVIDVPLAGRGTDARSGAALRELRRAVVPQTVGRLPGARAGVTGLTAGWADQAAELRANLPPVVAFVLVLAFVLLLAAFRSLVVALKAIALNLLSVAAAFGVLVLVFQHGVGARLLGLQVGGGIDPVVPLLLFVILFGLSMDYHVLIVGRIREAYDEGAGMDDAVRRGLGATAGVVTSAAGVMVAVFAIFATLSMPFFQEFGVGLATAILLDATLVRCVLLPATMTLLGRANWYCPRWLARTLARRAGEAT